MIHVRFGLPGLRRAASLGIATVVSVALVQAATPAVANDNLLNLTSWPAAALGITDAAGLEPLFAGIER